MLVLAFGGNRAAFGAARAARWLWTARAVHEPPGAPSPCGDLVAGRGGLWLAASVSRGGRTPEIHIEPLPAPNRWDVPADSTALRGRFAGAAPGLAAPRDGGLALVYLLEPDIVSAGAGARTGAAADAPYRIVLRRGAADARTWSEPQPLPQRPGAYALANGRLACTARGLWLVPAVRRDPADSTAAREVVCFVSRDAGNTWHETVALRAPDAADPAVAEAADGTLVLVLRHGSDLARCTSQDAGATWTAPVALGIPALASAHALCRLSGRAELGLAWADPAPDNTIALPGLQMLHLALSSDAGATWRRMWPLLMRPGIEARAPELESRGADLMALFTARTDTTSGLVATSYSWRELERDAHLPPPERARGRYSLDPATAREALRVVTAGTLARPSRSVRLFVESYFMRSLVAAHEVLAPHHGEVADSVDTRAGLQRAIAYADRLVQTQDMHGYWPLGYGAVFVADMAVPVGLFAALEPHVDAARLAGYESAARRLIAALRQDAMLFPDGKAGVGWPNSIIIRRPARAVRDPYLVSTALAGIGVQSWLYHRTHEPGYRASALASLEYTLTQLRPDGSLPAFGSEGELTTAAYVEQGWMTADAWLDDPAVLERLRRMLPVHVDWLLRKQGPDGIWNGGTQGEFTRTPSILDFLVWYDQRCEPRDDVRLALRRGSVPFLDPERWHAYGLFHAGSDYEVLRAVSGRVLAALAGERFVL